MNPVLTVIIVTYKSRDEITECLQSIPRSLEDRPVQVIVVDNHSQDGIVSRVKASFPHVLMIESDVNQGFSKANNRAYEQALGEFILFLNPDTVSNETAYRHCLERLRTDKTIGIISPKLVMANGEMDLACRRSIPSAWDGCCRALGLAAKFPHIPLFSGYNLTHLPENESYEVGAVNGAFMMSPRKALMRFGVFDEQFFMYGDDLDLCYRCRQAGYRVIYDGRVQIIHYKGVSSSKLANQMSDEVFRATQQFYLKHFNPHHSLLVYGKYKLLFGAWKTVSKLRAKKHGYAKARPL